MTKSTSAIVMSVVLTLVLTLRHDALSLPAMIFDAGTGGAYHQKGTGTGSSSTKTKLPVSSKGTPIASSIPQITWKECRDEALVLGSDPTEDISSRAPKEQRLDLSRKDQIATLIQELLDWIDLNTAYDVTISRKMPPAVNFCRSGDSIIYEDQDLNVDDRLAAVYDIKSRTITIVEPWSPEKHYDVSRLLHELIHDVQTRKRTWTCWGDAEWKAYKLQEKWLAARGIQSGFNWMQIFVLTRCRRDIHP